MICVGCYFRDPAARDAEVAITAHDDYQKLGIGTFLVQLLMKIALQNGLQAFPADVLQGNHGMLQDFHGVASTMEAGVYHLRFPLTAPAATDEGQTLR